MSSLSQASTKFVRAYPAAQNVIILMQFSDSRSGAHNSSSADRIVGEWLSLVEHLVRDQGVGGSNPLSPTISNQPLTILQILQIEPLVRRLWVPRLKVRFH